jgi:hypothetical protein
MKVQNRLQQILQELGIKTMIPTHDLLHGKLGGMTLRRFNKLLHNSAVRPITVAEMQMLGEWLSGLAGKSISEIQLIELSKKEEALV